MIIIFTLIGFVLGCTVAIVHQRKKSLLQKLPPQDPFQKLPPQDPFQKLPPQDPSYLEDKMWYEAELDFLFKFNEKLVSAFSLKGVIQCIAEAAHNFLPIERTAFLTWDKNSEKFTLACAIGWHYDCNKELLTIGKDSISGLVISNREKLVVFDLAQDYYLSKLKKEEHFLQKAFISVPLIYKDEVLGVLHVCDKKASGTFTQRDVEVAMNIGRMGAIVLQNA
ncbi:GAF domain-containing protein, partial [Candidatus Omnitrophota bacterium]